MITNLAIRSVDLLAVLMGHISTQVRPLLMKRLTQNTIYLEGKIQVISFTDISETVMLEKDIYQEKILTH